MRRVALSLVAACALALAVLPVAGTTVEPVAAQGQSGTVNVEWLGWNFWRFTSPTGKVVLANPWVANPDSPVSVADITKADLILVTNGHEDEVGQAVQIAQQTGAPLMAGGWDLGQWFIEVGVPRAQVVTTGAGGRHRLDGITVRVVNSVHGSAINAPPGPTAANPSGGIAAAYIVTFENGWTVYYGGSSAATYDVALWAQTYKPDAAIINLDSSREPMDFAMHVKLLTTENPNLSAVFPGHHSVIQQGTTIAEAQQAVWDMGLTQTVIEPLIGQVYSFTK